MRDGNTIVFTEVKYRSGSGAGDPLEAVGFHKQKQIVNTARFFLLRFGFSGSTPCRFDVIGILGNRITHIENAFGAR